MPRVIRDSDDESDDENIEENLGTASKLHVNASVTNSVPRATDGSTESLKNAIQVAHRDHFESPNDPSGLTLEDALDSSRAPSEYQNKRRKLTSDPSSPGPTPLRRSPIQTYGTSKPIFSSPLLQAFPANQQQPRYDAGATNNQWDLEGTIRDDYTRHEPMALFPEPSSTIPNATATQQRLFDQVAQDWETDRHLVDEVTDPTFLGIVTEQDFLEPPALNVPPKSSIPWSGSECDRLVSSDELPPVQWSDFIKTQSENSTAPPHQDLGHNQPSSHHEGTARLQNPRDESPRQSQHGQRGSSVRLKDSPAENGGHPENIEQSIPTPSKIEPSNPAPSKLQIMEHALEDSPAEPISLQNKSVATPMPPPQKGEKQTEGTQTPNHSRTKRKSSAAPISDDYLEDIGLPKEQYKPRPSRSRTVGSSLVEPSDYSKIPERAVRKGSRRSKTTGSIDNTDAKCTPQAIKQLEDMGLRFSSSTTKKALEQSGGDVSQAANWLLDNGTAEDQDELSPSRTPKPKGQTSKRKSSKATKPAANGDGPSSENIPPQNEGQIAPLGATAESEVTTIPVFEDTTHGVDLRYDTTNTSHHTSPIKVQVVIHSDPAAESKTKEQLTETSTTKTKNPEDDNPTKKAKCRKGPLDPLEAVEEENQPEIPAEPVKEKRKARGRAKKGSIAALPAVSPEGPSEKPETTEAQPDAVVQTKDAEDQTKQSLAPDPELPVTTPPILAISAAVSAPTKPTETPEKKSRTKTAQSPPLSKGKTPYRVGLSKRARIAPLLKIVKK